MVIGLGSISGGMGCAMIMIVMLSKGGEGEASNQLL